MIVLDQDGVIQAEPVIDPAAAPYGVLLQAPKAGGGLSGVGDPHAGSLHRVHIGAGQSGDA